MRYFNYTYYHLVNVKRNGFVKICSPVSEIYKFQDRRFVSQVASRKSFSLCTVLAGSIA